MKLLIYMAYNGADFCGYQVQPNGYTVQEALNHATEALFGYPCDITGCSRTDSGVHAHMFCATVTKKGSSTFTTVIPLDRIPRALCIHLPNSLAVYHAQMAPDGFHARYSVTSKEYLYRICNTPTRSPFEINRAWHIPTPVSDDSLEKMSLAATHFVGRRDFSACMAAGSRIMDAYRHVMASSITRRGDIIEFRVRADGFLYHMVRILAGTLVEIAEGKMDPLSIPARLDSLDRRSMGRTAPAAGLYLDRVYYDDPDRPGYHGGAIHET